MRIAIFNDTGSVPHLGSQGVMRALRTSLEERGAEVVLSWPTWSDWTAVEEDFSRLEVDLVVVNGEGTIHDDLSRPYVKSLLSLPSFAREVWGVETWLINASVTSLSDEAITLLRSFAEIYVRDSHSVEYLANRGLFGRHVADLLLIDAQSQLEKVEQSYAGSTVVVTDSVIPHLSRQLESYADLRKLGFFAIEERVHHTKGFLGWVKRSLSCPGCALGRAGGHSLGGLGRIAKAGFVITGRYHGVVACIAFGVPFVALESNTGKIRWLLRDVFDDTSRVSSSFAELRKQVEDPDQHCFSEAEETSARAFIQDHRNRASKMFDEMIR